MTKSNKCKRCGVEASKLFTVLIVPTNLEVMLGVSQEHKEKWCAKCKQEHAN